MMADSESQPLSTPAEQLRRLLSVLWRRRLLVATIILLTTGVAAVTSVREPRRYDASAKVLLHQQEPIESITGTGSTSRPADPERDINTKVDLITLESVAAHVRAQLRLARSAGDLVKQVRAAPQGNSDIIVVTARDRDPHAAAAIATAFARQYVAFRRRSARAAIQQAADLATRQLEELSPAAAGSLQGRQLAERLRELEITAALQTGGAEVVLSATPPTSAATPRPLRTGILALILSAILGCAAACGIELLDRRLRKEEDIEEAFAAPVISAIPRPGRRTAGISVDDVEQTEAYHALALSLRYPFISDEIRSIIVSSVREGDGKTHVTLGIARALAVQGRRVLVIEADLRQPSFAHYLGLPQGRGLMRVLADWASTRDQTFEIDAATLTLTSADDSAGRPPSFSVLPVGPVPANHHRALASARMQSVLAQARENADMVLIDTPPLGLVSDARALGDRADAILMVARFERTTKDDARRAVRALRTAGMPLLGVVLTGTSPAGVRHYGQHRKTPVPPGARTAAP